MKYSTHIDPTWESMKYYCHIDISEVMVLYICARINTDNHLASTIILIDVWTSWTKESYSGQHSPIHELILVFQVVVRRIITCGDMLLFNVTIKRFDCENLKKRYEINFNIPA